MRMRGLTPQDAAWLAWIATRMDDTVGDTIIIDLVYDYVFILRLVMVVAVV